MMALSFHPIISPTVIDVVGEIIPHQEIFRDKNDR